LTGVFALSINPLRPATVYAGTILSASKSVDGGQSWTFITAFDSGVHSFAFDPSAPGTVYAGTFFSGVFQTTQGGGSWSVVANGLPKESGFFSGFFSIYALAIDPSSPSTVYAGIGFGGGSIYKSTNGGQSWTDISPGVIGDVLSVAIDPSATKTIY